jgi:hypothetical protein
MRRNQAPHCLEERKMLNDLDIMTDNDIYAARYEIAGAIVNAKGLAAFYAKEASTRAQGLAMRDIALRAEARLLSVTRP